MAGVHYLVFDVESVADGELVSRIRFPGKGLSASAAVAQYRADLMAQHGNDFIPYTFHIPVAIAVAKVNADLELMELVTLDEPRFRPHVLADIFWRGWQKHKEPTLVSFNGRTFDIPLLELAAFRFGLSQPNWFDLTSKSFEQPRNRYNVSAHFDLQDFLTNYGASRLTGGLDLIATLLGKPGKMDVEGCMVQDMYEAGKLSEISDYCQCDVLDTYFVFLRSQVMLGRISIERESALVKGAKAYLAQRSGANAAFQRYLDNWGDWNNPFQAV